MADGAQTPSSAAAREKRGGPLLVSLAFALVALSALLAAAWFYVRVLAPERRSAARAPVTEFDAAVMRQSTAPEAVAAEQQALLALGNNYRVESIDVFSPADPVVFGGMLGEDFQIAAGNMLRFFRLEATPMGRKVLAGAPSAS